MEKNENGYPVKNKDAVAVFNSDTKAGERRLNCRGDMVGGESVGENHTCGGDGSCLDNAALAYVYAPSQRFRMLYSAKDALSHGTLFEELYKPKEVYGRE
ncbi:MAG: spore coat associated protein CotJA [Clostridia bacterium]|nr:spore coat associated protein CotJA [Clostridia bacterium]